MMQSHATPQSITLDKQVSIRIVVGSLGCMQYEFASRNAQCLVSLVKEGAKGRSKAREEGKQKVKEGKEMVTKIVNHVRSFHRFHFLWTKFTKYYISVGKSYKMLKYS
jgi:hypothetical protein